MGGALSYTYEEGKVMFSLSLRAAGPVLASPATSDALPEGLVA
jgi:hypothetical protein